MVTFLPDQQPHLLLRPEGELLSLKEAQVPSGAFAMRPLNQANIRQLAESDPQRWPAILVTRCTAGYIVLDGYHRWEAAKRMHLDQITAVCRAYTSGHEVIEVAFRANLLHGLQANVQTKGDYAYWLHVTFEDLSQTEIATRAMMTQGAVSKAIALRDQQTKRLLHQGEDTDQEEQQQAVIRSCQRLTKDITRFLKGVEGLDDATILHRLHTVVTTSEDKAKLARLVRLLSSEGAGETSGQRRLRQFATRPIGSHSHQ